jgi:hypothetical protein
MTVAVGMSSTSVFPGAALYPRGGTAVQRPRRDDTFNA